MIKIDANSSFIETNSFFNKQSNEAKFEIIFFDPPFAENYFTDEIKMIKESIIYKKKHLIIIHRDVKSKDELDKIVNIILTRSYGRSRIIFATF